MRIELAAKNLTVAYDGFNALTIKELLLSGQNIAILGHNGAGKSTLIKSLLGLTPSITGHLSVSAEFSCGRQVLTASRDMAFCPETGSIFADVPVESYIKFWSRFKHGDPQYYIKSGSRYMEALNIAPLLLKLGRELSKGQKRRVQTAIGFLCKPKLFLFDEPFDGLDIQRTSELAELIADHKEEMAFMVSSHRMDIMERFADSALVLKLGEVAAYGSIESVCKQLAGQSVLLSGVADIDRGVSLLRTCFPQSYVSRLGNQISITGHNLSTEKIRDAISRLGSASVLVEIAPARLTDAMSLHLSMLSTRSTESKRSPL